jgi:predicted DNA-binding transcriptional regulator YafY
MLKKLKRVGDSILRSGRLLSALMLLQAHGRLSTRELAERLEISQRTAHRDMEALCAAGVPVLALRGAQGGWELARGWRTKVPGLDEAELRALLMSQPSVLGHPGLAAASERAFGKLMAAMPRSMQTQAASIRARLHIDPAGWRPSAEDFSVLPIVQEAIARDCKLTFLYSRADGESGVRTVDPFGMVAKQAVWYLVARAPAGMRTYRISRMQNAVILAVTFTRPSTFDLAAHWKTATAQLQEKREQFRATLAVAPDAAASLKRWCLVSAAPGVQSVPAIPADWTLLHVSFESRDEARFIVLGFGARAHILAPADLRDQVVEETRAAGKLQANCSRFIPSL